MINISPYVKPLEQKPAVFAEWKDPCQKQLLACTLAKGDLSDFILIQSQSTTTVSGSATVASGTVANRLVFSIGYPADIIQITYNWSELAHQQNQTFADMLNEQKKPIQIPQDFIDSPSIESGLKNIA